MSSYQHLIATAGLDPQEFLTSAAVARLVDRTPDTIRRFAREGRLPFKRAFGGMRLYRLVDVLKLRESLCAKVEPLAALDAIAVEPDGTAPDAPLSRNNTPPVDRDDGHMDQGHASDAHGPGIPPGWALYPDAYSSR